MRKLPGGQAGSATSLHCSAANALRRSPRPDQFHDLSEQMAEAVLQVSDRGRSRPGCRTRVQHPVLAA